MMKLINIMLVCLIIFTLTSQKARAQNIFVSPNGDDRYTGLEDQPLRTLEEAKNRVRLFKSQSQKEPITVQLRGGKYSLGKSFTLGATDSGVDLYPVTYQAFMNERVEILGSETIQASMIKEVPAVEYKFFSKLKSNSLHIYYIESEKLSFERGKNDGRGQFYPYIADLNYNGKKLVNAHWPESSWSKTVATSNQSDGDDGFSYTDLFPGNPNDYPNTLLHGYFEQNWADEYLTIKNISENPGFIATENPNSYPIKFKEGQRWRALNLRSAMDDNGEYYVDYQQKRIYFVAGTVNLSDIFEVNSLTDPIILIKNATNINFKNIKFGNTLGTAFKVESSKGVSISNCDFTNINGSGIEISGGENNQLINSSLAHIGGTGVNVYGGDRKTLRSSRHLIANNTIQNFGLIRNTYAPAINVAGVGVTVDGNIIFNGPHAAILLSGNNHLVTKNDISKVVQQTADAGMIYIGRDWSMRGSIITDNYLHDSISSMGGEINAIYLDDLASGITVSKNIVKNVARGLLIGGGRDNVVEGNLFINTDKPIWFDARGLNTKRDVIQKASPGSTWDLISKLKNVDFTSRVYKSAYPELATILDEQPLEPRGNSISNNNYTGVNGFYNGNAPENPSWYLLKNNHNIKDADIKNLAPSGNGEWFAFAKLVKE
ncbi:right-handed parallel beta-helix repeat-containing protein [Methylomonas sp. ZR1]|uniref:right-handed parallel beta-helix repeat-containing protein n=1 Tax=Methylomonas sp. ZR1 TaxID=1797072 RepID=UPI001492C00D|nr:right-handed parallel beta-helix repeat-containing protein [Methylomonas sp. ZR1]NOV31561.1 right-handed parallel beta-helix repeat-containing protein [Methylomonas sp. ZR1]